MPKKTGKGQGRGHTYGMDKGKAGDIARDPGGFAGSGTRPRVQAAQKNIRKLVGEGYRLDPNAKTSQTYKKAVASAGSASGRLAKLVKVR